MRDITIRAVIAGIVAVMLKDLFDLVYINSGFPGVSMHKVAAGTFVSLENLTSIGFLIGFVAHYTIGGVIGLLFTHYLSFTNKSYPIIKGTFAGIVVWLFLAGMLLRFGISAYNPIDESSNLMLLLDHLVFGFTLGFLNKIFVLKDNIY